MSPVSRKELGVGDCRIVIQKMTERIIFKSKISPLFMPIFNTYSVGSSVRGRKKKRVRKRKVQLPKQGGSSRQQKVYNGNRSKVQRKYKR